MNLSKGKDLLHRRVARKMLLLRLEADEEDSGDLIDCDNASHLSKTDKLEKRTVTLGDIEPVPESSPTTAPPPPPTACSKLMCIPS
ncbi:hypothetical protein EVAR_416_1 [Eumeta japonica]|uniref:Uncharacterized protein n=1 Tax=Eumeta variegata TaxID=151549 RepID=A0A4C1SD93_EUMVA|nr:hypothetical protein EVAR_416_1 [Eumeta japonica]